MWSVPARHSDACITQTSKLVILAIRYTGKKTPGGAGTHIRDTHGTRRRTKAHKRHTDHADDQPHNHPDSQTHITVHRQSFHFDTRGHRTGAHKGGTSTPLEGPWTVPGPIPDSRFVHTTSTSSARATCCGLWVVGLVVAWRPFGG